MGVVVRRYIDILTIIINFPYSTCIRSFLAAASVLLCSFLKCFFSLVYYISKERRCNEDLRAVRNFKIERIIRYRRTRFKCEHVIIANCDFSLSVQLLERNV